MTAEAESTSAVVPRSPQKETPPSEERNEAESEECDTEQTAEGDEGGPDEGLRPAA